MDEQPKSELEHAWRYFALHANQRMLVFNFYLVLSGLVLAALAKALEGDVAPPWFSILLGIFLAVVSFVFWKLDQRTCFLIKHAEEALAELELALPSERARLFRLESDRTGREKSTTKWWNPHWTYRESFRWVFGLMGFFGVGSAIWSALPLIRCVVDWATAQF